MGNRVGSSPTDRIYGCKTVQEELKFCTFFCVPFDTETIACRKILFYNTDKEGGNYEYGTIAVNE